MPDLLLHSMSEFAELIIEALDLAGAAHVVEIGAEYGGMTQRLAAYAEDVGGRLTSIDPAPQPEFLAWVGGQPHVRHLSLPSLAALKQVSHADAWLIDGDHNWFTVFHELSAIEAICRRDGRPMLVFLHDIGWPAGRRDQYYAPDCIPAPFRQPFDYEGGVMPGVNATLPGRGFRGLGHFAWAGAEGGPRNGVLTAVEDFVEAAERPLAFAEVPAVFGLGVLFDQDASWSEALGQSLLPYHQNGLIAALEANRLASYLRVIELQDEAAEAAACPRAAA